MIACDSAGMRVVECGQIMPWCLRVLAEVEMVMADEELALQMRLTELTMEEQQDEAAAESLMDTLLEKQAKPL